MKTFVIDYSIYRANKIVNHRAVVSAVNEDNALEKFYAVLDLKYEEALIPSPRVREMVEDEVVFLK